MYNRGQGEPDWYQQFQAFPSVWDELCRSPAGRGEVTIDGKKTRQNIIPKCQEYRRMKSSVLSDENLVETFRLFNNDTVNDQTEDLNKMKNIEGTALK